MYSFLYRLGQRCARHPLRVFAAWVFAATAVVGLKASVGGPTKDNYRIPGVESQRANDVLRQRFHAQSGASGDIVFHVGQGSISDPPNESAVSAAIAQLAKGADVTAVTNPFDPTSPTVSADRRTAYATVNYSTRVLTSLNTNQASAAADIARHAGVQAELTGTIAQTQKADGKEGVGLAVAVIVLLFAFGSVIAMGIPIGTALAGLGIGLGGVGILAGLVDVPTVSPTLAKMIGLGVGIDYALFIVTRHREHLHQGMSPVDAAAKAIATAGQSVLFAGTTVVVAIAGLVMAGLPAVTTMGFATAICVVVAMAVAVTLLPALLGLIGTRIDKWSVPHRRVDPAKAHETLSARWAHHVGHRPWRFALVSLAALLALAAPVVGLRLGFVDDSNASASSTQHKAYDLLAAGFGKGFNGPLSVVVEQPGGDQPATLARVAQATASDPGIAAVQRPLLNPAGDTAVITALPTTSPQDAATASTVNRLRASVLPPAVAHTGATALVTGQTAVSDDLSHRLTSRLPAFIAAVVALSFVLLMIVFRSVFVPLKAAIMNMLSISAAYGVIVAVFEWGWAKSLFGLHATVPINPFVPMIMFAILFGLSMDYEVFLLSRVREAFLRSGDSHSSVVDGLAATARVITSAALIMISVFLAFVPSGNVTVKMFGLGLASAVLIDATLVRMVLVPATMSLLGRANWWLPSWLDRVLPRMDLEGTEVGTEAAGEGSDEGRIAA
jgi:RND superfamily putative drug exporter